MHPLLDWLVANVEPYVSFRWLLSVVLGAMALQPLLATAFFLHDLRRPRGELAPREAQLVRIGLRFGGLLLLRLFTFDTLRRHRGLLLQIAGLAAAAIALHAWVFTFEE